MKRRIIPVLLVVALLVTALTITAMAAETPVAPNDASEYARTELSAALASVPTNGSGSAYCPVCNKTVTWYSTGSSGNVNLQTYHWFIQGDVSNTGYYFVESGKSACFYLNGHNVTSSSVAFETNSGATLNIIGNGDEIVSASGYGNLAQYGDTLHTYGGTTNLYGGIYQKSSSDAGPVAGAKVAYTLNMYNGTTIRNGANSGNVGGNIGLYASGTAVNIYGGTVSGGSATNGGNIGVSSGCTVTLNGGTVTGGSAGNGGNIFSTGSTVNIGGSTVTLGVASGNGGNIYMEGGALAVTSGELSAGSANNEGGNLYSDSYTNINISGGSFTGGSAKNGGSISLGNSYLTFTGGSISGGKATNYGGNLYLSALVTQYGSITVNNNDGGAVPTVSDGEATNYGGNIYLNVYSGKTATLEDLSLLGGSASDGGGLFLTGSGTLNMNDVSFDGGSAANGGNFYNSGITVNISGGSFADGNATVQGGNIFSYYGTVTVKDGTQISNGSATYDGGNVYLTYYCKCNLAAEITGGTAGRWGGSIAVENSTLNISNSTVSGGSAAYGGCIYPFAGAKLDITNTTVSNGEATYGGNLFVASDAGAVTLTDSTVSGGVAPTGGNGYFSGATTLTNCVFTTKENATGTGTQFYNDATVTLDGCTLADGSVFADGSITAKASKLYAVTIRKGTLTLQGATDITSASMSTVDSVYAELVVDSTFTGTVNIAGLANGSVAYGAKLADTYTANGDFTGKVILAAMGAKPWAFHDNSGLVVGNARTVKEEGEDKIVTWHKDNAAAAQNYGDADYMYPGNRDLPLAGGNYVVNVSGWTMNVTGTGNVTFYDSANADFTTYGTVTVNGPAVSNTFATVGPDGYTYYMVKEGDTYSFHRVSVKVNGVSIRPSVAGIYYTSVWQCDAKLAEKIQSFGVAVSLKDQPTDGFRNDGDTLFTKFLKDEFESGKTMTSVLISNILAEDKDNADRATKSIYATAYIILDDGTEAGTVAVDGNDVNFSLKQAMERIDNNPKVYLNSKTQVDNFYNTWKTVMESWNFQNIGKYTTDPAEDDSLNVLMIGNSFCYYYVQELYDLMEQDGIQANVYNLYKSGCTLEEHYNWWNSNHNGYQFFWKTNADGYNLVNSDKTYVTMADSLMAENWDVISIQESLFKNIQAADRDAYIAQAKVYMDTLIPMLQKAFPNAKIYWHQQWCPEVGFTQGQNSIADAAAQANYAQKEAALAAFAQETYGVKIVNTGDAWVNFRANEEYAALLPDGGLCARNGEDGFAGTNGGDGYHDGDIGGGQFLNACVWYETLIEDGDCTTKDFRADKLGYTLSAELVKALQNTAHATVNK